MSFVWDRFISVVDPVFCREVVTGWLRGSGEPITEEDWYIVMCDLCESVCAGESIRVRNLGYLCVRSEHREVRRWSYGAAQFCSDFCLAIRILLSICSREVVESEVQFELMRLLYESASKKLMVSLNENLDAEILWDISRGTKLSKGTKFLFPLEEINTNYPQIRLSELMERRFNVDKESLKYNLSRAMIDSIEESQPLGRYTDSVDSFFVSSGVVIIEGDRLSPGPRAPIPPMSGRF